MCKCVHTFFSSELVVPNQDMSLKILELLWQGRQFKIYNFQRLRTFCTICLLMYQRPHKFGIDNSSKEADPRLVRYAMHCVDKGVHNIVVCTIDAYAYG